MSGRGGREINPVWNKYFLKSLIHASDGINIANGNMNHNNDNFGVSGIDVIESDL